MGPKITFFTYYYLFFLIFIFVVSENITSKDHGPYDISKVYSDVAICRGHMPNNVSKLELVKPGPNQPFFLLKGEFKQPVIVNEARQFLYSVKNNVKTQVWHTKVKNPCQNYALAFVFQTALNSSKCTTIQPGNYSIKINDFKLITKTFGSSFYYGKFATKTIILAKTGNICCISAVLEFVPKL